MKKVLRLVMIVGVLSTVSISAYSVCAPGSYFLANGGHLVPYYEGHQLLGEKCILGPSSCSCIGMIYYY